MLADILTSPQFISLVIVPATAAVLGWVGYRVKQLVERNISAQDRETIAFWAKRAVDYAEQTGATLAAAERYRIARETASTFLAARGIKLSEEELRVIIEATVLQAKLEALRLGAKPA